MKTKITLTNTFHRTEVNLLVDAPNKLGEYQISESQARRAIRALCGMADCQCGGMCEWDPVYDVEGWRENDTPTTLVVRDLHNSRCADYYQQHGGIDEVLGR